MLDHSARQRIRTHMSEVIGSGATPDTLHAHRQTLALELGVPLNRVASVSAWLVINAKRAIAEADLGKKLTYQNLLFADRYLGPTIDPKALSEVSETLGLSDSELAKAVDRYRQLNDGVRRPSNGAAAEAQGAPLEISIPDKGTGPAHTNYDFDTKERWRETWQHYLSAHFSRDELYRARVICLPSPYVEREVKHYRLLGIQPQNIYAVEGGDEVARTIFETESRRAGINFFKGDLGDFLEKTDQRFDIVNFDYPGQACRSYIRQIARVPITARAAILLNLMARRESADMQDGLRLWQAMTHDSSYHYRRATDVFHAVQQGSYGEGYEPAWNKTQVGDDSLAELRDNHGDAAILGGLGFSCPTNHGFYSPWIKQLLERGDIHWVVHFVTKNCNAVAGALSSQLAERGSPTSGVNLFGVAKTVIFGAPETGSGARYGYASAASTARTPFHSAYAIAQLPPEELRHQSRHSARFLREICQEILNQAAGDNSTTTLDVKISTDGSSKVTRKAEAVVTIGNRRCVSISFGRLAEDIDRVSAWRRSVTQDSLTSDSPKRIWLEE